MLLESHDTAAWDLGDWRIPSGCLFVPALFGGEVTGFPTGCLSVPALFGGRVTDLTLWTRLTGFPARCFFVSTLLCGSVPDLTVGAFCHRAIIYTREIYKSYEA
jgi:hypothetical protein